MRCLACDNELSDAESQRKYLFINEHIDLCTKCTDEAGIERADKGNRESTIDKESANLPLESEEVFVDDEILG